MQLPDESPLSLVLDRLYEVVWLRNLWIHRSAITWLTGKPKALRALRNILGNSPYQAHVGVHTGGANAYYG